MPRCSSAAPSWYLPGRAVLLDEADVLQRAQDAVRGALGQAERARELAEAEPARAAGEQPQDRGGPLDRLDRARARRGCYDRTSDAAFDNVDRRSLTAGGSDVDGHPTRRHTSLGRITDGRMAAYRRTWRTTEGPALVGELAAEFAGTMILILFGVRRGGPGRRRRRSATTTASPGPGASASRSASTSPARISGAHLNPAVTIALAAFKGFAWRKVAAVHRSPSSSARSSRRCSCAGTTPRSWHTVDPGHTIKTQGVFSTLPGNGTLPVQQWGAFRDQIIGTAILLFLILALTDLRNTAAAAEPRPVHRRPARRRHRHGLGHQRRLRHQPGP